MKQVSLQSIRGFNLRQQLALALGNTYAYGLQCIGRRCSVLLSCGGLADCRTDISCAGIIAAHPCKNTQGWGTLSRNARKDRYSGIPAVRVTLNGP